VPRPLERGGRTVGPPETGTVRRGPLVFRRIKDKLGESLAVGREGTRTKEESAGPRGIIKAAWVVLEREKQSRQ